MIDAELTQLFVRTVETGNIAAAAKSLGISSSYASRKLNTLEERLGSRLLVRTTRSVKLTTAGETYLSFARELLERSNKFSEDLIALRQSPSGLVKIAGRIYTGQFYLKRSMAAFCRVHPNIRFRVALSENPFELLSQGYDLGIDAGPLPEGNFVEQQVHHYSRVVCASPDFVSRHGELCHDLRGLETLACLHYRADDTAPAWHFLDSEGRLIRQKVNVLVEANSWALLRELALQGIGVISVSTHLIGEDITNGNLVPIFCNYRCVDPKGQLFAIRLIYPERQLPYRVRLFAQYLEHELREISLRMNAFDNMSL